MLLRINDLQSRVDNYQRGVQTRQLLVRGPTVVDVIQANLDTPERWLDFTTQLALKSTGWGAINPIHLGAAAAIGLLGFILGRTVPRRLRARAARMQVEEQEVSAGLVQAVIACSVSYAPILLALGGISAYLTLIPRAGGDLPFVISLVYGLLAYFVIAAGIRSLLSPCPPASYYLTLPETVATPLSRRSRVLALVVLIAWLVRKLYADELLDETMFTLIRQIIGLVWVLNVIWVLWLLRRLENWRDKWTLPLLISLALLGGLVAAWVGYINLGALVIRGITNTLVLFGLALVVGQFFSDLFDGLDAGRYRWQKAVRRAIGLKGDEFVPGLDWMRLLLNLALWIGVVLLVLRTWGADEVTVEILRYFREGFQVAGMTIVPGQLLWAILALVVLLTLVRWVKGRLDSRWLAKTRMERSAREALVTTFGYVAVALAIIVALSIAGIEFTNLAIIAGALSVGIGFGLQNVVNNFVSGIIMLVERPVRTGDWIVVGSTEGHVQRISIRTTTIQTFDRAEVIVPNSDLISGQVTNWTLRNQWGRIKVPIGVAYGSDTAAVREILLEIAQNNADVIKGNPTLSDPSVLFLGFGDSSLNFELRAMIPNIDQRFRVISDINFAIDAAFREQGIEIPFPQRDVNFRGPLQIESDQQGPRAAPDGGDLPQA
jgi:small-conductance mechanosensitive channel